MLVSDIEGDLARNGADRPVPFDVERGAQLADVELATPPRGCLRFREIMPTPAPGVPSSPRNQANPTPRGGLEPAKPSRPHPSGWLRAR